MTATRAASSTRTTQEANAARGTTSNDAIRQSFLNDLEELRARAAELEAELDAAPSGEHDSRFEIEYQLGSIKSDIADLETAISSLERGSYGDCVECGNPIAVERLEALPETTLCVSCAS